MKTTTAFAALAKNRRNQRIATALFIVKSLTKSGIPAKFPVEPRDCFDTAEAAQREASRRAELNPGRRYTVVQNN
jgi:hypothetical protein